MNHSDNRPSMIRRGVARALGVVLSISAAGACLPALAQTTGEAGTLEEVLVTVSRVTESIQDVPVAVNVLSGEALQDLRVETIGDVLTYTPGAQFSGGSPDQTDIYIRGISSDIYGASGDAAVVTMIDNSVVSRSWMRTGYFFDMDRIEVARGPQGTTFGRNATAGVVHFLTRRPEFSNDSSVSVDYGNYDYLKATGVLNPQVSDSVALRLSGEYLRRDGFYQSETTGEDLDNLDVKAARAQLLWQPSDRLEVLFRSNYAEDHLDVPGPVGARFSDIPIVFLSPAAGLVYTPVDDDDPFTVGAMPQGQFFDRTLWDAGVEASYDASSALTLTSVTNFRHGRVDTDRDLWGTTVPVLRQESFEDADILQQELRLDNSAAQARLGWVAGVYYLQEETVRFEQKDLVLGTPLQTYQSFRQENETHSYGVFGNLKYDLTDSTVLSAGARYSYDEKDYRVPFHVCGAVPNRSGDPALAGPQAGGLPGALCGIFIQDYPNLTLLSGGNEANWDDVSYRLSLTQKFFDDALNVYASYATGYKGGGFVNEPNNNLPESYLPYDPETVATVEIGAKADLFHKVRVDIAIYDTDYEDIQVETISAQTGTAITFNSSGATIQGVEAQLDWGVTDRISLTANGNYMDAKYDAPGLIDPAGVVLSAGRFNGLPLWTAFFAGSYTQPLASGASLRLHLDVSMSADFEGQLTIPGSPLDGMPDDDPKDPVVGANINWLSADGALGLSLWGRNVTNRENLQLGGPFAIDRTHLFFPGRFQGSKRAIAPRTYGVSVTYHFE